MLSHCGLSAFFETAHLVKSQSKEYVVDLDVINQSEDWFEIGFDYELFKQFSDRLTLQVTGVIDVHLIENDEDEFDVAFSPKKASRILFVMQIPNENRSSLGVLIAIIAVLLVGAVLAGVCFWYRRSKSAALGDIAARDNSTSYIAPEDKKNSTQISYV